MTLVEFQILLPLLIEAGKTIKYVAELIARLESGETVTQEEVDAAMVKVKDAVANWDQTPPG